MHQGIEEVILILGGLVRAEEVAADPHSKMPRRMVINTASQEDVAEAAPGITQTFSQVLEVYQPRTMDLSGRPGIKAQTRLRLACGAA
jgi:hypothetical protein